MTDMLLTELEWGMIKKLQGGMKLSVERAKYYKKKKGSPMRLLYMETT